MTEEKMQLVQPILDTIENEDIKEFAIVLLDGLPEYIWHVGASSTGKYHPKYSLGEGGLMRHQMAVVRFLNFFFELEQYNSKLTNREMDLVRVCGLVHDGRKSGAQEDYEKCKYTRFDHPLRMAKVIREYEGKYLTSEEIEFMASVVASHMGQFNTDKKGEVILPKPANKFQRMLHVADYLASRKCLTMDFDGYTEVKPELPKLEDYKVSFPKHKGKTLLQIKEEDPGYIAWMKTKDDWKEPIKSLLKQL